MKRLWIIQECIECYINIAHIRCSWSELRGNHTFASGLRALQTERRREGLPSLHGSHRLRNIFTGEVFIPPND